MLFWAIIFLVSFWVLGILSVLGVVWVRREEEIAPWVNDGRKSS
jgi:hypothetical protein